MVTTPDAQGSRVMVFALMSGIATPDSQDGRGALRAGGVRETRRGCGALIDGGGGVIKAARVTLCG